MTSENDLEKRTCEESTPDTLKLFRIQRTNYSDDPRDGRCYLGENSWTYVARDREEAVKRFKEVVENELVTRYSVYEDLRKENVKRDMVYFKENRKKIDEERERGIRYDNDVDDYGEWERRFKIELEAKLRKEQEEQERKLHTLVQIGNVNNEYEDWTIEEVSMRRALDVPKLADSDAKDFSIDALVSCNTDGTKMVEYVILERKGGE